MADEQRRSIRQRLAAIVIAGIGTAAASVFSYATAIYEAANPEPMREVSPGEMVDTGRWHVAVTEARFGPVPPTGVKPYEPKNYLMVDVSLDNRSASSAYASRKLLTLDPPNPALTDPTFYIIRDKWIAGRVNPGMPEKLTAAWEWPQGEAPPQEIRLLIGSEIYKKRDNLYGASTWLDRDPIAVIQLPVRISSAEGEG
ncbi:hypothetical protein F9K94_18245 [Brucella tritici]|jgi:hypothetical protein|uniref:DUF4352 domain-containing protein n=1 Tax=Brucella tritici TaxID=94626 RepID=A0A7V8B222_9HYPH|nr:hypothetical protein [Brucella tritici]KAB2656426.1 hypothetical protein F9K94_18245 [Brucella tritici]